MPEASSCIRVSHFSGRGPKQLGYPSLPSHYQGSVLEVEQQEHDLELSWDVSVTGASLSYSTTIVGPRDSLPLIKRESFHLLVNSQNGYNDCDSTRPKPGSWDVHLVSHPGGYKELKHLGHIPLFFLSKGLNRGTATEI